MNLEFENEKHFARWVDMKGGILYLVGGAVRDKIMGIKPKDKDYAIAYLKEEDLPFKRVGKDFPVFLVNIGGKPCEVALCRTETSTGAGHTDFKVETNNVSIYNDLGRRDFTMNAMAINVLTDYLIDPYGGEYDINMGRIRHVGEDNTFSDDPLRILRAARFAARFNFGINFDTGTAMVNHAGKLSNISGERIALELKKVYNECEPEDFRLFFDILWGVSSIDYAFPEINALHVPDKHDGTAYNHVMKLLKYARSWDMFLMILAHDLGKGVTNPTTHPSHHDHDNLGIEVARNMADRLRLSNHEKMLMMTASEEHMRIKNFSSMRPSKKIRFAKKHGKDHAHNLLVLSLIDSIGREGADPGFEAENFADNIQDLKLAFKGIDSISGDDLIFEGVRPGPNFGQQLEQYRISYFKQHSK